MWLLIGVRFLFMVLGAHPVAITKLVLFLDKENVMTVCHSSFCVPLVSVRMCKSAKS
jgi:hypothetical protein